MNQISLTGRLCADPELKSTNSGKKVVQVNLAVQRTKDKADFIPVVAWEEKAEFINKYFKKGDGIEVCGILTSRNYEDKNGNKRNAIEVLVHAISFPVGKKSEATNTSNADFEEVETTEDVPF